MTEVAAGMEMPRIEFPCDYPIRIIGTYEPGIDREVLDVVRRFDRRVTSDDLSLHFSRTRKYVSVRLTLRATGEEQLRALFEALKQDDRISLVL